MTLMDRFGTDDECRMVLEELRWPKGAVCTRCGSNKLSRMYKRDQFDCDACGYQFSVMAGTVFHDTHLPLRKWFMATYIMCESKKGVSANQLKRMLGVSYKTAWYLCHRIRSAMVESQGALLAGIVEADETFVGGKLRVPKAILEERRLTGNEVPFDWRKNKSTVLGAIERGGKLRIRKARNNRKGEITAFLNAMVADNAAAIYTDELKSYKKVGDADTMHASVNHKQDEWVRGDVHTNTVESAWSLLKRSIIGSYHRLSAKHLEAYLAEFEFRFNNRENEYLFRDTLTRLVTAENLSYARLISPRLVKT
jgi:transposase-like protein